MRKKISLLLSSVLLLSSIVWAADNDGWTEAPSTDAAENGAWEEWCARWEDTKNDWEKISITPGADETELNFAWYSNSTSQIPEFRWYEDEVLSAAGAVAVTQTNAVPGYASNKVTVKNIKPGTTYYYSYTKDGEWTAPAEYKSAASTSDFSFVFFGDPQIGSSLENVAENAGSGELTELGQDRAVRNDSFNWNNTLEKAMELNPDTAFMVSAGDQIQTRDKKTADSTHTSFVKNEIEYSGYLSPEILKSVPVATTIGNHDALSSNYSYHFNNPNASDIGATYAGGDYYFSYGNALFIMINTNNTNVAEHSSFIKRACAAYENAPWKIVTLHQDIYGSGEHSNEPEIMELRYGLAPVFEENGIDVVLTGHDHTYSRSYMMNTSYADEDKFISEDDFEAYIDGDKEIDSVYNDYLTAIEDAEYIAETDNEEVTNPEGILYLTANSASGSKYYDLVEHQQAYIAARWQEDVPTFSMIDVSNNKFTINTYRTDTMEKIDNEFTIVKDSSATLTESTTETTTLTEETTTETTTKRVSGNGGGHGASTLFIGKKTTAATEATTETTTRTAVEKTTELTTASNDGVKVTIGSKKVYINGNEEEMDAAPYIQSSSNSTMVPLRFVALAVSSGDIENADSADNIKWDGVTKTVTVVVGDNTARFEAGSNAITLNGSEVIMDNSAAAEIKDGRMYIPFRALGKVLNADAEWNADTKTAVYK